MSPVRSGRRGLLAAALAFTLVASPLRPDARADSGTSVEAVSTWGTALAANGRAQPVLALAVTGRTVFLGGEFTAMVAPGAGAESAETRTRNHLAALNVDSHALLPWNPDADGPVRAMALSADKKKLYVGGDFGHIGGTPAPFLALVDLKTGQVDPNFRPRLLGRVRALALAGDRLYVGGHFTSVGGPAGVEPRSKLAALDALTGELLPWAPPALGPGRYVGHTGIPTPTESSGDVLSIAVPADGSRVFVGGTFIDFAGQGGLLVLDPVTAQPLPERWDPQRPVFSLAVSPADGQTVFASAGGPGGRVYAFSPAMPDRPLWSSPVDGDAPGVAASATTVYLMGHYDYAGPEQVLRRHLAAFDATTGEVDEWNPVANTSTGAFAAAVGADHVFVGGEFTMINGRPQPGFAQFAAPAAPTTSTTSTTSTSRSRRPPRRPPTLRREAPPRRR
jgi:hypothetical protein